MGEEEEVSGNTSLHLETRSEELDVNASDPKPSRLGSIATDATNISHPSTVQAGSSSDDELDSRSVSEELVCAGQSDAWEPLPYPRESSAFGFQAIDSELLLNSAVDNISKDQFELESARNAVLGSNITEFPDDKRQDIADLTGDTLADVGASSGAYCNAVDMSLPDEGARVNTKGRGAEDGDGVAVIVSKHLDWPLSFLWSIAQFVGFGGSKLHNESQDIRTIIRTA